MEESIKQQRVLTSFSSASTPQRGRQKWFPSPREGIPRSPQKPESANRDNNPVGPRPLSIPFGRWAGPWASWLPGQGVHAGRPSRRRLGAKTLAARALLHGAAGAAEGKAEAVFAATGREKRRAECCGQGPQSGQRRPGRETGSGHVPPECTAPVGC